jgi:hypothetical protein
MKKSLVLISCLLLSAAVLLAGVGCINNSITEDGFVRYGSYMGTIFNAITGEPIGGDNLEVYLIQGTDKDKADKLVKDTDDDFVGDYAFKDVAFGVNPGDLDFRIVVLNEGYQRFEAIVSLAAGLVVGNGGLNTVGDIDSVYSNEKLNFIGNIYLYPLDTSPGDLTVTVRDPQGDPVSGATVLLKQDALNNAATAITGTALAPVTGLHPSLSGTSDASGVVTFSGDELVLGGSYILTAEAITLADGQELQTKTNANFVVGVNTLNQTVNMAAATGSALALVSRSNQNGVVASNGVLTMTFNQPISLDTTAGKFTAVLANTTAVLDVTTPVTAALSNGNKTLTITPNFTTNPATTDNGATITYAYNGSDIVTTNNGVDTGNGPFDNALSGAGAGQVKLTS